MSVFAGTTFFAKPLSVWLGGLLFLLCGLLFSGCGSKKPVVEKSAALTGAERLERRATSAYGKGDLLGASKDFQTALQVYESLAMTDAAAGVQLSLARIDSDEGRAKEALTRVNAALAQTAAISQGTAMLAHGRAAGLYLQQKDKASAATSLAAAERLCANTCDATSALLALRANLALASGDAAVAKSTATAALTQAQKPSDKANALRGLAESNLALGLLPDAINQAEQALQIDQEQGQSARVIADLNLLVAIYSKTGNNEKSTAYRALSQAATKARMQLTTR